MVKCGICGAEVEEQPKITAEGKCSACGAKLEVKKNPAKKEPCCGK